MCGKSAPMPTHMARRRRRAQQRQMHRLNVGRSRDSPLGFCVAKVLLSALQRTHPARATRCAANLAPQLHPPSHPRAGEVLPTSPRKAVFLSGVRGRFLLTQSKESASGIAALPNASLQRRAACSPREGVEALPYNGAIKRKRLRKGLKFQKNQK